MTRPTERDIAAHFNEGIDCCAPRRNAAKRPTVKLVKLLREHLRATGIEGRTALELGCGRGELSAELIEDGATEVTGIDLSSDAIEYAKRIAMEDRLNERVEFLVGNAAEMDLPTRDALVHHRVICCYPDVAQFLDRSIAAARSMYAFSMPRSRGPWGIGVRIALLFENLIHRLKRRGFRAYVHDEGKVESALAQAGFRLRERSNRGGWFAAVYAR